MCVWCVCVSDDMIVEKNKDNSFRLLSWDPEEWWGQRKWGQVEKKEKDYTKHHSIKYDDSIYVKLICAYIYKEIGIRS